MSRPNRLCFLKSYPIEYAPQLARSIWPTWGPPGADSTVVGPCWPHKTYYQGHYQQTSYWSILARWQLDISTFIQFCIPLNEIVDGNVCYIGLILFVLLSACPSTRPWTKSCLCNFPRILRDRFKLGTHETHGNKVRCMFECWRGSFWYGKMHKAPLDWL